MILYSYPICPISNKLKILFKLLNIEFEEIKINSRQNNEKIPKIDMFFLPLLSVNNVIFRDISSILIYLRNEYKNELLEEWFNDEKIQYFEIFFDKYMFFDIFKYAIFEKTEKLILNNEYFANNDTQIIGINNIKFYLDILENLFSKNEWIQSKFSINDISGFCFLASMDYCFLVPWQKYPNIKKWYRRMKSRGDFNFILANKISNINPPIHYSIIDF